MKKNLKDTVIEQSSSFLRMVGAEMPSNSDLIKWAEQGRLHTKYVDCTTAAVIND
jgi:hypothetical protein